MAGSEGTLIPTMILFGLVFGRWWRACLALAAMLWPAVLVVDGVMDLSVGLLGAAVFGAANAAVGIAVHQAALWAVRRLRGPGRAVRAG